MRVAHSQIEDDPSSNEGPPSLLSVGPSVLRVASSDLRVVLSILRVMATNFEERLTFTNCTEQFMEREGVIHFFEGQNLAPLWVTY